MSVSSLSTVQLLSAQLQAQDTTLSQLSTQLATGNKYADLTDYDPTDALNLLNLQASVTQKNAYLNVIGTVQTRLSGYDTTMTDMESVVAQAQSLIAGDGTYSAANASNVGIMASNYLQSMQLDLNQQIDGRYIYGGSQYTAAPVSSTLGTTTTTNPSSTIETDGQTLPSYAANAVNLAVDNTANTITVSGGVGGTGIAQTATISINGVPQTYTLSAADTTPAEAASDLVTQITAATGIPVSSTGAVISVPGGNTIDSAAGTTTDSAAYTAESATIDSGDTINYGVTSNNPAFQKIIAGLQYMQAAGNTTDSATYAADIAQASSLLDSGLSALQTVHSSVAYSIDSLTTETTTQNDAITSLTDQLDNIQQVNVAQVSTEITALESQLQASYSVTGTIERMSLVDYL